MTIALEEEEIYYLGYKGDKNIGMIVEGISQILGYKMDVNTIKIGSKTIKIDFQKGFLEERVITENYKNYELSEEDIQKVVLDSITKTIIENYENIEKVIYSVSGKKIN